MPVTPTYPGVYIEEVSSGVRALAGVATSVTAFIGRASRGPVNDPVFINSYGEFERTFGGLWTQSSLGFAVRDFYLNGGTQAIIVRVVETSAKKATISASSLTLEAASEGVWGNDLEVTITKVDNSLFNLSVLDTGTGALEELLNLSVNPNESRRVDKVLENRSKLLRLTNSSDLEGGTLNFPTAAKYTATTDSGTDGLQIEASDVEGEPGKKTGIYALEDADIFNLLCIPPYDITDISDVGVYLSLMSKAGTYCDSRRAFLIADPPPSWTAAEGSGDIQTVIDNMVDLPGNTNAAVFFPRLRQPNPLKDNQMENFAPSGAVAGIFARTDANRGIWKAPAGLDATLSGVPSLSVNLTDGQNGRLNPLGINCLRAKPPAGRIVWGSRTLKGADQLASEWKYIPVRRIALYIEESLFRGSQWVVFEPNDEPLWAQIRLSFNSFMHGLFRQGAFQGSSPKDAYFVKCDKETTTQDDINLGKVNIVVGFAPLKPAEFVIIKIQQMAGQS